MERRKDFVHAMKVIQFDVRESSGNGHEFIEQVIREAKKMGFVLPILGWEDDAELKGDEIFNEIAMLLDDIERGAGLQYHLLVDGPIGRIADGNARNAKKEKALRRKFRKAWDLDCAT